MVDSARKGSFKMLSANCNQCDRHHKEQEWRQVQPSEGIIIVAVLGTHHFNKQQLEMRCCCVGHEASQQHPDNVGQVLGNVSAAEQRHRLRKLARLDVGKLARILLLLECRPESLCSIHTRLLLPPPTTCACFEAN